jgi:hypothetical protein
MKLKRRQQSQAGKEGRNGKTEDAKQRILNACFIPPSLPPFSWRP